MEFETIRKYVVSCPRCSRKMTEVEADELMEHACQRTCQGCRTHWQVDIQTRDRDHFAIAYVNLGQRPKRPAREPVGLERRFGA